MFPEVVVAVVKHPIRPDDVELPYRYERVSKGVKLVHVGYMYHDRGSEYIDGYM